MFIHNIKFVLIWFLVMGISRFTYSQSNLNFLENIKEIPLRSTSDIFNEFEGQWAPFKNKQTKKIENTDTYWREFQSQLTAYKTAGDEWIENFADRNLNFEEFKEMMENYFLVYTLNIIFNDLKNNINAQSYINAINQIEATRQYENAPIDFLHCEHNYDLTIKKIKRRLLNHESVIEKLQRECIKGAKHSLFHRLYESWKLKDLALLNIELSKYKLKEILSLSILSSQ